MADLVNQQTGAVENTPSEEAFTNIASGQYSVPDKQTALINPDGKLFYGNDSDEATTLIGQGWRPAQPEDIMNQAAKEVVAENPITSGIATAAGSFTNSVLAGVPEELYENTGSDQDKMQAKALDSQLKTQDPGLNIAGGLAGTATLLMAPGISTALGAFGDAAAGAVTKAAQIGGDSLAQSMATKAVATGAKFGAENMALNLPYRASEEILGDPSIASEGLLGTAAEDFGVGFIGGAGVSGFSSILAPAIKWGADLSTGVLSSDKLQQWSDTALLKQMGFQKSAFKKLDEIVGDTEEIDGQTVRKSRAGMTQDMVNLINENTTPLQRFMGPSGGVEGFSNALTNAEETLNGMRTEGNTAGDMFSHQQLSDFADNIETKYVNKHGVQDVPAVPAPIIMSSEQLQTNIAKYGTDERMWPSMEQPAQRIVPPSGQADMNSVAQLRSQIDAMATKKYLSQGLSQEESAARIAAGQMPTYNFDDMHDLRQSLYAIGSYPFKTDAIQDAIMGSRDLMDRGMVQARAKLNNPQFNSTFEQVNKNYSQIRTTLEKILEPGLAGSEARNVVGLGAKVLGAGGAMLGGTIRPLAGLAQGMFLQHYGNYALHQTLGLAAGSLEGISANINKSIDAILTNDKVQKTALGSVNLWSRYHNDDKITPIEGYAKFQNDLAAVQQNPGNLNAGLIAGVPTVPTYMPRNWTLMCSNANNAIRYLQQIAPQPPQAMYDGGSPRPWQPSDNQLSKYSRSVNAVFDPMSILNEMASGTLTKESVAAVQNTMPNLYGAIQQQVQNRLAIADPSQVYKIRQKLGLILSNNQNPIDRANKISALQQGFIPNNNHVKPNANSKITESSRATTDINRMSNE